MTTTHRRIALLTGASLSALGVSVLTATPALAAPHDTAATGVHPGVTATTDIITICDLATPTPGSPCFFGDNEQHASPVVAVVNSPANGQIRQTHVGTTTLILGNPVGDSAEVGAIAIVTDTPAFGSATARLGSAVEQTAQAGDTIKVEFDNGGNFLIDASAL